LDYHWIGSLGMIAAIDSMAINVTSLRHMLAPLLLICFVVAIILYFGFFGYWVGIWANVHHYNQRRSKMSIPIILQPGFIAADHSTWLARVYDHQIMQVLQP
jgi:hypothetical protein